MLSDEVVELLRKNKLLALYHEVCEEITRLRDYQWKIAYYFISLSGGLIALMVSNTIKPIMTCSIKYIITIVQLLSAFYSIYYLETNHRHLTLQRNIRRHIEELLQYYDEGVYSSKSLLPADWKGKRITRMFQRVGLLTPLMTMVSLVQFFAIYLIWKIH